MKVPGHIAVSLTVGSVLYNHSHSFSAFLWFLIAGILIDVDHYLDYMREYGISLNLKRVYNTCGNPMAFKRLGLILHSYEFVIVLWLAIFIFDLSIIWSYAAIGFTLHLIIDQAVNPVRPLAYFLSYRIANNFRTKLIFSGKEVDHGDWYR